MFFSEAILSRRGPLAKVWLAAHMERKLSKTQTLQADISESVGAIVGDEVEIMALRLSGQLLLGVVRIYSRKAKYLLDDCNEALLKIKMAFRPGVVDMTEGQLAVNKNTITLQDNNIDLDLLLPDVNWDFDFEDRPQQRQGQHVARAADITLASANDMALGLDGLDFDFDLGPGDGIGSQDFDLDLGIDFGDGPVIDDADKTGAGDETMSVELGRDAASMRSPRASLDSHLLGKGNDDARSHRSREMSENPFGGDIDMDFGPDVNGMDIDLGLDFGDGPGDISAVNAIPAVPEKEKSVSRASSPLTSVPGTPAPEDGNEANVVEQPVDKDATPKKRKYANKKQIIDRETELEVGPGGRNRNGVNDAARDISNIITEHHFLPRSRSVMRLLEIRRDPLAHFLPTKTTANGTFFFAGPPGLAPELADMFMRPVFNTLAKNKRGASPEKGANKRPRLDKDAVDEEEVEQERRAASVARSIALGSEALHRASMGPDMDFGAGDNTGAGMDDFQFDVPMDVPMDAGLDDMQTLMDRERARSKSRLSTPAMDGELFDDGKETYADMDCPIKLFDERPSQSQSQQDMVEQEGKGYSRNTVKALSLIRKELSPPGDKDKVMSFQEMSHKASRRAASSFFFELLVLGTRDCVKLSQGGAHENIEVRAKDKLWERQRHASIAPSITPNA